MTLDLLPLYEKQKELEKMVRENLGMTEEEFTSNEMIDRRVFAFKVELGEFANETAWFKYWKQNHQMVRSKTIEELADCIHFLLAIGIYREYEKFIVELDADYWHSLPLEHLYESIMENSFASSGLWRTAFEQLLSIGLRLGFSLEDIELSYYLKNQKNIERQLNHY